MRSRDFRRRNREEAVREYFYGRKPHTLFPFSFEVPFAEVQIYKIGGKIYSTAGTHRAGEGTCNCTLRNVNSKIQIQQNMIAVVVTKSRKRSPCSVLDLAEEVRETFPACYTPQKYEFILPLWRFHQKVGAKRLLNSL